MNDIDIAVRNLKWAVALLAVTVLLHVVLLAMKLWR